MHLTQLFDPSLIGRASRVGLEYTGEDGLVLRLTFGELDGRASRVSLMTVALLHHLMCRRNTSFVWSPIEARAARERWRTARLNRTLSGAAAAGDAGESGALSEPAATMNRNA